MVNDPQAILLGLYRESSSCKTIEAKRSHVVKEIVFNGEPYRVTEDTVDGDIIWKVFKDNAELTREEIVNLYAGSNLRRQMNK